MARTITPQEQRDEARHAAAQIEHLAQQIWDALIDNSPDSLTDNRLIRCQRLAGELSPPYNRTWQAYNTSLIHLHLDAAQALLRADKYVSDGIRPQTINVAAMLIDRVRKAAMDIEHAPDPAETETK